MKLQVSEIVEAYSLYASIPSPSSAYVLRGSDDSSVSVHSTWTVRDLKRSELTRFSRNHLGLRNMGNVQFVPTGPPQDVTSQSAVAFSPSGNKTAVLRQITLKGEKLQNLEIWDSKRKVRTFLVKNIKEHGKIYDDGQFGCLSWSPSEECLLYVAEKKQPKFESFFEKSIKCGNGDSASKSPDEETVKGEENLFREDWGESLVGKHHSVLSVLNVNTGHVNVISIGENISVGQAIWISDKTVVCVGWLEDPRRLGLIYCTNRRSDLYSISIENAHTEILCQTSGSVRSPRYIPEKDILLFVDNKSGGPHRCTDRLVKFHLETGQQQVVVDIVENPAEEGAFPGLYVENLPDRCWSKDGNYIFISSPWRSKKVIVSVNLNTGEVKPINIDDNLGSCSVLDVNNDVIIVSASSPSIEPHLLAGMLFFKTGSEFSIKWITLDGSPLRIAGVKWSIINFVPTPENENKRYPGITYDAVMVSPDTTSEHTPMIVWPHGGPHSVFIAAFQLYSTVFVKLGFAVCMVNYRGSIGFGENSVQSLLGNVGVQDVKDVQFAVESIMKRDDLKISKAVLFGGSHGGFLVTHLSGQYPDFYKVCVCRNPVIDISGMVESTDIPDWNWVESGLGDQFDFGTNPDPELLKAMWLMSPIRYIKNVKIPTLVLLGKNDLRVPPSQGRKYYFTLLARNIPVKMYVFEDNHALSTVGVEAEGFVQIMLWLTEHLHND